MPPHRAPFRWRAATAWTVTGALVLSALFLAGSAAGTSPTGTTVAPATRGNGVASPDVGSASAVDGSASTFEIVGSVAADVDGYGEAPPLKGVNVTAFGASCSSSPAGPSTCPIDAWARTNASGGYHFRLASGDYYIAALPDRSVRGASYPDGFGGDAVYRAIAAHTVVDLTVYPYVAYGNRSIVLPDYACDSAYVDDVGGDGPGCQNPVLSWTQDGAYYVTDVGELSFYSFVNRTLTAIASWTPLYQSFPSYAMIPNALFSTQDGTYLYDWGTLAPSGTGITAEAVNVTTGRSFEYNFTGVNTSAVRANGQVQLTGWDGNDSQLTLILDNGSVLDHPLWGEGQSYVGKLDYFEANNVYWEPFLNGYVNVEAQGNSSDGIEEWQLTGPGEIQLTRTYKATWGSGIVVNGVNGVALNVTSRELFVQAEWSGLTYAIGPGGTLTALLGVTDTYPSGAPPSVPLGVASESDRPQLVASGPMMASEYAGFGNDSWIVDTTPGHVGYYSTNVSPYFPNHSVDGVPISSWAQWGQEGQFYNASYLIAPDSYTCTPDFSGACTIDGGEDSAIGTIWWMWRLGSPEFPNPNSAPPADETGPVGLTVGISESTNSRIVLAWNAPATAGVVNYSVQWGPGTLLDHSVSLPASTTTWALSGLASGTEYAVSVTAWNLHYEGMSPAHVEALTLGPAPPTDLVAATISTDAITWSWTQSAGAGVSNDTLALFEGGGCRGSPERYSTQGPNDTIAVTDLLSFATYSAEVVGWNASGESTPSACVEATTLEATSSIYPVEFSESGLPLADLWYVNVTQGPSLESTGAAPTEAVELANGTYEYTTATNDSRYAPTALAGSVTIAGAGVTATPIDFAPVRYAVDFTESGLPKGTNWTVGIGASTRSSTGSGLDWPLGNGSFDYSVTIAAGGATHGSVDVTGTAVDVSLAYYRVTFRESGLPNDTSWDLKTNDVLFDSPTRLIVVYLTDADYSYQPGAIAGYEIPIGGTYSVAGALISIGVKYLAQHDVDPGMAAAGTSGPAAIRRTSWVTDARPRPTVPVPH